MLRNVVVLLSNKIFFNKLERVYLKPDLSQEIATSFLKPIYKRKNKKMKTPKFSNTDKYLANQRKYQDITLHKLGLKLLKQFKNVITYRVF